MTTTAIDNTGDAHTNAEELGLRVWDCLADMRTGYAEPDKEALRKAANALLFAENVREAPKESVYLANVVLEWLSGFFPDSFERLQPASRIYEEARINRPR